MSAGARAPGEETLGPSARVVRRRQLAARARRRRLALIDAALALVLALLALVLAPGLAIVALAALLVLLVCTAWAVLARLRYRTAQRTSGEEREERRRWT